MTTLYRPILIESAEQAEALTYGTVARRDVGSRIEVMVKHAPWTWWVGGEQFLRVGPEVAIGFEALVPIEAEEEHKGLPVFPRPTDAPWPPRSTPNQDADGRWYYIDEDGYSAAHLGDHPFHDLMVAWIDSLPRTTRLVTPWEPQQ